MLFSIVRSVIIVLVLYFFLTNIECNPNTRISNSSVRPYVYSSSGANVGCKGRVHTSGAYGWTPRTLQKSSGQKTDPLTRPPLFLTAYIRIV